MGTIRDTPHPYYGAEAERDYQTEYETLDEMIQWAASYDEDMNFVYRWDWYVPPQEDIALAAEEGEEMPSETLTLFVVLQRKSRFLNISAPVTTGDEEKVREFLASDRILGALRRTWAPLLDTTEETP
jgi:hypothetical protein